MKLLSPGAEVLHVGRRSTIKAVDFEGYPRAVKRFGTSVEARESLANELAVRESLSERPWLLPILGVDGNEVMFPLLPADSRLDRAATRMSADEKREVARQAAHILLELLTEGWAHRDFHAGNLFWVDGTLVVTDLETAVQYPAGRRPPLSECYDVTGEGLSSPYLTDRACWSAQREESLCSVLGVSSDEALGLVESDLKRSLLEASLSFESRNRRHDCRAGRIYSSIDLRPHLVVAPEVTQRNCRRRFELFGIESDAIAGRSVLDLGCNIGGMVFEAQRLNPSRSLGIEIDQDKVAVARAVAAFAGLTGVEFECGDVDNLSAEDLGKHETVFCLAIEAHVRQPERLYELLAGVCSDLLFFEANGGTSPTDVERHLKRAGFSQVEYLGCSDDDRLVENRNRPVFRARR